VEKWFPKRNQKEKKKRSTPKSLIRFGLTNKQHHNRKLQKITASTQKTVAALVKVIGGELHGT
jgi:hypothetical protein